MKAPATMQAMPSSCLLMLTVISFPPGLRLIRLRQFCPRGSRPGFGAGGFGSGGILVFSSGLMVLFHLRASTGGFCCPLPEGIGSPGAGLSQTKPVGKSSESRFKAVSTSGVSLWCCGCHEGVYGRCWRLSEAFQRGVRGLCPSPAVLGWGVVDGAITVYHGTKRPGEEEVIQGGVVAGARFRIPVQNPAGARGSGLVGEISWLPDHPGGPQVFSLELSARKSQRPEPQ